MIVLDLCIRSTDAHRPLPFAVQVDSEPFVVLQSIGAETAIQIPIDDTVSGDHTINFLLLEKPQNYTQVDQGTIVSDVVLEMLDLRLGSIDLRHLVIDQARYTHDYHGLEPRAAHRFSGVMGCCGTVAWPVQFPFYLWLLEHY